MATVDANCDMGGEEDFLPLSLLGLPLVALCTWAIRRARPATMGWPGLLHLPLLVSVVGALRGALRRATVEGFSLCHRADSTEFLETMGGRRGDAVDRLCAPLLVLGCVGCVALAVAEARRWWRQRAG